MPTICQASTLSYRCKLKKGELRHGSCPQGAHSLLWKTDNYDKMWQIFQEKYESSAIMIYWKRLILLQEKMSNIYDET